MLLNFKVKKQFKSKNKKICTVYVDVYWEDLLRFRILENNQHYTIQIMDILKIFQSSEKKLFAPSFVMLDFWLYGL